MYNEMGQVPIRVVNPNDDPNVMHGRKILVKEALTRSGHSGSLTTALKHQRPHPLIRTGRKVDQRIPIQGTSAWSDTDLISGVSTTGAVHCMNTERPFFLGRIKLANMQHL